MAEKTLDVGAIQAFLREFARDRDWEQFHSPKNLAAGVVIEAAELMENFHWSTNEQSARVMDDPAKAAAVRDEMADVLGYLAAPGRRALHRSARGDVGEAPPKRREVPRPPGARELEEVHGVPRRLNSRP